MHAVHIGDVRVKYNALVRKFLIKVERFRMLHTLIFRRLIPDALMRSTIRLAT
jgi:hypothetical protein